MLPDLLLLLAILCVLGAFSWLISKAPFLDPDMKAVAKWVLLVLLVVLVLWWVIGMLTGSPLHWPR